MPTAQELTFFRSALPFWDCLSEEDRDMLVQNIQILTASAGELVYNAGDKCLGVLFLREGRLRVYLAGAVGREITLYFIGLNDMTMLASSCILNTPALPVTVEAEEDAQLYVIPPQVYTHLLASCPDAERYLTQALNHSFRLTLKAVESVVFLTLEQRMALLLLQQRSFEQSPRLHLTQEKLSRQLGTAREVVSRQLRRFADSGCLRTFRGGIELLDEEALAALAPEVF